MTNKILLSLAVVSCLSLYGAEEDTQTNDNQTQEEQQIEEQNDGETTETENETQTDDEKNNEETSSNNTTVDSSLELSISLVDLTNQMTNTQNTQKMVQLSQEINTLANQINTLASTIISSQEIKSDNLQETQQNMITIQNNMIAMTNEIAKEPSLSEEMNTIHQSLKSSQKTIGLAENSLNNTQQSKAIEEIQKSLEISSSLSELVVQLDNVKPQYRFMVMNEIKKKLAKENNKERIATIQTELSTTLENSRASKQINLSGTLNNINQNQKTQNSAFGTGEMDRGTSSSTGGGMSNISSAGGMNSSAGGMGGVSSGGMSSGGGMGGM